MSEIQKDSRDVVLEYIKRDIREIKDLLSNHYVTKAELAAAKAELVPVKSDVKKLQDNVVWLVRLIIATIVVALLSVVIKGQV